MILPKTIIIIIFNHFISPAIKNNEINLEKEYYDLLKYNSVLIKLIRNCSNLSKVFNTEILPKLSFSRFIIDNNFPDSYTDSKRIQLLLQNRIPVQVSIDDNHNLPSILNSDSLLRNITHLRYRFSTKLYYDNNSSVDGSSISGNNSVLRSINNQIINHQDIFKSMVHLDKAVFIIGPSVPQDIINRILLDLKESRLSEIRFIYSSVVVGNGSIPLSDSTKSELVKLVERSKLYSLSVIDYFKVNRDYLDVFRNIKSLSFASKKNLHDDLADLNEFIGNSTKLENLILSTYQPNDQTQINQLFLVVLSKHPSLKTIKVVHMGKLKLSSVIHFLNNNQVVTTFHLNSTSLVNDIVPYSNMTEDIYNTTLTEFCQNRSMLVSPLVFWRGVIGIKRLIIAIENKQFLPIIKDQLLAHLEDLEISIHIDISDFVEEILSKTKTLQTLVISSSFNLQSSASAWERIINGILSNSTLKHLKLNGNIPPKLLQNLFIHSHTSLLSILLTIPESSDSQSLQTIMKQNCTLKSMKLVTPYSHALLVDKIN
ncbi:hypothetical protein DLAC_00837 [Tieghemostelium lacteum]|uniref:Uncharacterized protein n=1 Tax=Tieghemostelium lacteum TaxID=361077 RepID=A0A152A737_TIELA|nr:hypothetical protein DLAC_00837 [Tieghemostelium lacteum]|eukprot:KYR02040.1 hypothetical protein DLAC_00837 [Tieghemostelium lacteum]